MKRPRRGGSGARVSCPLYAASLAPSKGRLIRCTVLGSTSGDIALDKAQTSARFPFPTRGVQELAYGKDLKGGMVPGLALVPGIVAFAGGLPIMTEGKVHIGGIGVSGGTSDQDETCAQAGLDAVKDSLK